MQEKTLSNWVHHMSQVHHMSNLPTFVSVRSECFDRDFLTQCWIHLPLLHVVGTFHVSDQVPHLLCDVRLVGRSFHHGVAVGSHAPDTQAGRLNKHCSVSGVNEVGPSKDGALIGASSTGRAYKKLKKKN